MVDSDQSNPKVKLHYRVSRGGLPEKGEYAKIDNRK